MSYKKAPYPIEVEAGKRYAFCTCGLSEELPHCDGGHKGTGKKAMKMTFSQNEKIVVCGCGKTGESPYCDGSHRLPS